MIVLLAGCSGTPEAKGEPFVLLELFTSQSCSSCPPADIELNAVEARRVAEDNRELAIAWHVDYWNDLGWVDPYSSAEATQRQFAYVDAIPTRRYTPQMVANGREDFVGHDNDARRAAIDRWTAQPALARVSITPGEIVDGELQVDVEVVGAPAGSELLVALLQSDITTFVASGENAGRTLEHDNVVRSTVHTAPESGRIVLPVPADVTSPGVVAIVQDPDSLEVHGAALVQLEPGVALTGTVTDPAGAPLAGATLQACAEVCLVADADGSGAFRFDGLAPGDWSLHASGPSPDDAHLVVPVTVAADTEVALVVPPLGPAIPVPATPTWVEVAPGLSIQLDPDHLPGITEVRAAALDGAAWPPIPDRTITTGWSLSPTGAGTDLAFEVDGEALCTAADGRSWIECDHLPELGSIVLVQ